MYCKYIDFRSCIGSRIANCIHSCVDISPSQRRCSTYMTTTTIISTRCYIRWQYSLTSRHWLLHRHSCSPLFLTTSIIQPSSLRRRRQTVMITSHGTIHRFWTLSITVHVEAKAKVWISCVAIGGTAERKNQWHCWMQMWVSSWWMFVIASVRRSVASESWCCFVYWSGV